MKGMRSNRALGAIALLASAVTILMSAKIALAGDTTLCRTYADAKYKGGYFVIGNPPLDPDDWEPRDPTDPSFGIKCETLACTVTCWRGDWTNGFHLSVNVPLPFIMCDCADSPQSELDSCHIIAQFNPANGQFVRYSCLGSCEDPEICMLKVSNVVIHGLPGGGYSSADIECLCQ